MILQAMILQAMIFGLKNKISQLKGFKSISITVYLCLRVLAIYLEEFYGGIIYLSSKKSAGYDFAGYDFLIFFENFAGYDFRLSKMKYLSSKDFNRSRSPFNYV
jgi:hypothetical protein